MLLRTMQIGVKFWGFVRDKDTRLYINNTDYTEEMNNENWKRLEDLF